MHIVTAIARTVRTAVALAMLGAVALLGLAPAANAAVGGNAAWGAGVTCWSGRVDATLTVQAEYDGHWVAARRYLAVWDPQARQWQGQYTAWTTAQDPIGPAAAISARWQAAMPAGTAMQMWYQVAFYGNNGWSVLPWTAAAHTTHRWTASGTVGTTSGSYCLVS